MKKMKRLIQFLLFVVMLYFFIILGTKDFQTKIADNVRFSNDYKDVTRNNLYKYIGENEVLDLFNGKSGVLFFGFPSNIWSHYYADYLNEVATSSGLDTIYYYNFKRDRSMNNSAYNNIVQKLKEYLIMDDVGNMDIKAPMIVMLKEGQVIYLNNDVAFLKGDIAPEDYFTEEKKKVFKQELLIAMQQFKKDDVHE